MTWVSVNGVVSLAEEACLSVLDHGFLYGDSVYETLRTYGGKPFLLGPHLERLAASAAGLLLPQDFDVALLGEHVTAVLQRAGHAESLVRLIWSRGPGELSYDPDPAQRPTLVVIARPYSDLPAEAYERGIAVAVVDVRRNAISSLDPRLKTSNLLNPRLAYMQAHARGAAEAVLLTQQGTVAEGSRANLFLVEGGRVRTPSVDTGILNGITRRLALQLCAREDVAADETTLPAASLRTCDEAFMTSTTFGVMPVTRMDDAAVGSGQPGPVTRHLMAAYQRFVEAGDWRLGPAGVPHR